MTGREFIQTNKAPSAIGAYSQAVKYGQTVWISGQIPLDPISMEIVGNGDSVAGMKNQISQVCKNLAGICEEAGGNINNIVKINIFLTDMSHFQLVNEVMESIFKKPYPARAAVGVNSLPKNVCIEAEAIMILEN